MEKIRGYFYALLSAVLLGLMAILIKIVMNMGLSLLGAIFFRFTLAALFLGIFLIVKKISFRITKTQLIILLFVSVIGYGLMNLCYYGAFLYISVGLTGMIHYIYPVISVLLVRFLYKSTISKNVCIALILAVAGAMLLSFSDGGNIDPFGVLLALLAGVFYGFYAALMEHPAMVSLHGSVVVFYLALFTALFSVCLIPIFGESPWDSVEIETFGIMVCVALFCTVLALFLFREAVVRIGTVRTTILSTMEPVSAAVLGILLLGEDIDLGMIIGSVMILFSVVLITFSKNTADGTSMLRT